MTKRYAQSEILLERAKALIPLGAQTFSKSYTHLPYGAAPFFVEKGEGSHLWDVDGNEYIDFVSGLLSVSLGYQDPDVDHAVITQLQKGVSFSLSHPLELACAELIASLVPCAEMVRFGKNGSDVTAGAVRLARAVTDRDHVAVCGYHGWQDWYIGSTARRGGVPQATCDLTHPFNYNAIDSLDMIFRENPQQIAAVILEPMNRVFPQNNFLHDVKQLTHDHGALLIFDEIITGFRFDLGGAQRYFDVIPDLATFGKGMANGFPLSALVGPRDLMKRLDDLFFSFTFGGEALSLAAAQATITKMKNEPVIETLAQQGRMLQAGLSDLIETFDFGSYFGFSGHEAFTFFELYPQKDYDPYTLKTFLMQEILARGILSLGTHNLNYAHSDEDIQALLAVYREVLPLLVEAVNEKTLHQQLRCEPLKPLFLVR